MTGVKPFADVVEDRNVADRRLEHPPSPSGRSSKDDIAAGKCMAHRADVARFPAENVEDADAVLAGRDVGKRADTQVIGQRLGERGAHAARLRSMPIRADISARPPLFIHWSTAR